MSEQNNVFQLKKVAAKLTGKSVAQITGTTVADVLDFIQQNYTGGGSGGGLYIASVDLYANSEYAIKGGTITMSDGSTVEMIVSLIDELTLTASEGSATGKTKITVSPALESGDHYRYKTGSDIVPAKGEDLSDWSTWDGTSEISAQNGVDLLIAECDGSNKAVKCGLCNAVAPIF